MLMPSPGIRADQVAALMASPIFAGLTETAGPGAVPGGLFTPDDMPEEDWLRVVKGIAEGAGWLFYHTRDSRKSGAGFPDVVAVRERVVWAELKAERGRLTADQLRYRDALLAAGQEWYVWRPSDVAAVRETFGRRFPCGNEAGQ